MDSLGPVSPEHLKIGKAQRPVDTGNVLHHGSRAEDGSVDLGHRTSVHLRLRENSEDHNIAEPLPASRRDLYRNSRRSQPLVETVPRISRPRPAGQTFAGLPSRAPSRPRGPACVLRTESRVSLFCSIYSAICI